LHIALFYVIGDVFTMLHFSGRLKAFTFMSIVISKHLNTSYKLSTSMYSLANSLIVLHHLQVCCIQDDSIAEGRVEERTDFMHRASHYMVLRRKRIG
jgi:hypothetical protein